MAVIALTRQSLTMGDDQAAPNAGSVEVAGDARLPDIAQAIMASGYLGDAPRKGLNAWIAVHGRAAVAFGWAEGVAFVAPVGAPSAPADQIAELYLSKPQDSRADSVTAARAAAAERLMEDVLARFGKHNEYAGWASPPSIVRVIDLETTGSPPPAHGVCEIGWQDVALGEDGRWELFGDGGNRLVNPGRPMPPITEAVHHIRDIDVADAPWWHDVARPILDPYPRRIALAAHRAAFEEMFCTPALTRGADWICTWKCALRLWPDSPSFSNQVLRYWRKPKGLVHERGLPAHRAFPDAYVTAFHVRDQLNEASAAQLIQWSKEPGLLPRVRFGADRGKPWQEISNESLAGFLTDRDPDVRHTAETELTRRRGGGAIGKPSVQDLLL